MTKNNQKKVSEEISIELDKAWLVQWTFMSEQEEQKLKESGIDEKIIGIINSRKSFKKIYDLAIDIYAQNRATFLEKVSFMHYAKGEKNKKRFCKLSGPINTHYKSAVYQKIISLDDPKLVDTKLLKKWERHSEYVTIGYNPGLLIEKVYNIKVYEKNNGPEIIEYDKKLANGKLKRKKYEFKK